MAFVEAIPLQASNLDPLSEVVDTLAITLRKGISLPVTPPAMLQEARCWCAPSPTLSLRFSEDRGQYREQKRLGLARPCP